MTALTMTSFADALKEHYTPGEVARIVYDERPTLALIRKEEDWRGDKYIQPLVHGTPQGRSKTFATAQANTNPAQYERFEVTTVSDFGVLHIDLETIYASEGQPVDYFVKSRVSEMDGILDSLGESLATDIFRNGGGARGQRSGALGGGNTILTLADPEDSVNFEVGMKIRASAADGTSGALRGGSAVEITAIDRDAGTLTSADWTAITSFTDGDYLFVDGDFGAAPAGFAAWNPETAPGATLFFGVNRTVDITRLSGHRYTDSYPLVEKIQRATSAGRRHGAKYDFGVMNPVHYADIMIALQDKASYEMVESEDGLFGFEALVHRTPAGRIRYIEDPHCPPGIIRHMRLADMKFASRGPCPRVLDPDNVGEWLRRSSDPGVEGRWGYFGNLICENPRNLQVITGVPY